MKIIVALWAFAVLISVLLALTSCGIPSINEVIDDKGILCKAKIIVPEGAREGDEIDVDVNIYNCQPVEGEK